MSERTWGKFPLWWCKALRGKATAMAVAAVISKHADTDTGKNAYPKLETIAELTGVHVNRVSEAIAVLISAGIIARKLTGRAPRYQVFYDSPNSGESPNSSESPETGDPDLPESGDADSPTSLGQTRAFTRPSTRRSAAARAREEDPALKDAWSKVSPSDYEGRGIRDWDRFVASQIRKGEMPQVRTHALEDDFIRSLRGREKRSFDEIMGSESEPERQAC